MSFESELAHQRAQVEAALEKIFKKARGDADPLYSELIAETHRLVRRGGKRLRPLLMIETFKAHGGRLNPAVLEVAAALELIHQFLLIHDDVIDRDLIRYHGPNLIGRYQAKLRSQKTEGLHYANSAAILGGDLCYTLAISTVLNSSLPAATKNQVIESMITAVQSVIGGELADTFLPLNKKANYSKTRLLEIARKKTASYSFILPLQVGAALAGRDSVRYQKHLEGIGNNLGIAFQLQDDILGVFGDPARTGKSDKGDLGEGKRTLLMEYGLQKASRSDVRYLKKILSQRTLTAAEAKQVKTILTNSGALASVEAEIEDLFTQAQVGINKLPLNPQTKRRLNSFLKRLSGRQS